MTVTDKTTLAATAWAYITRADGPMPPLIARDWLMDHAECERDAAVKMLAEVAYDTLVYVRSETDTWTVTPSGILSRFGDGFYETVADDVADMREVEKTEPDDHQTAFWLAWCDRADRAIAILRELTAPDS